MTHYPIRDAFSYLLTASVISAIAPHVSDNHSDNKVLSFIELVFGVVFTIVLLRETFNINNKGDKKDYLKRFISLSLVTFIRLLLFATVPIIVLTVALQVIDSLNMLAYHNIRQVFIFSVTVLTSIAYYVMLTNSVKRVSRPD